VCSCVTGAICVPKQLDLSLDTGISQKRSVRRKRPRVPSRQTLMAIAQALDVPYATVNTLAAGAGYAPMFSEMRGLSRDGERTTLEAACCGSTSRFRTGHGSLLHVLMTNEAGAALLGCFIDMEARQDRAHAAPDVRSPGHAPLVANWPDVARSLFERVYRESIAASSMIRQRIAGGAARLPT